MGLISTARNCWQLDANCIESAPIPHPTSIRVSIPASVKRFARCIDTIFLLACSRPSRVNSLFLASSPSFIWAFSRNIHWVCKEATRAAGSVYVAVSQSLGLLVGKGEDTFGVTPILLG